MKKKVHISDGLIKLDDYQIGRFIGIGGFGIVFEAIEKKTGNVVALKILKEKKLLARKKDQQSFVREVYIPSILDLPGIVKLIGFRYPLTNEEKETEKVKELTIACKKGGEIKVDLTSAIFISELMPKGSLEEITARYLDSKGVDCDGMNPTVRSKIIYGVASTMRKVHQHRVVHRDLKLENIFLNNKLEAKIADFGLSKVVFNNVEMTMNIGSPLYMAPELFIDGDENYSFPVDVYAFAMIIYKMFTNKVVFPDKKPIRSPQQFMMKISRGDRPIRPENIPDCYWALINDCWKQDPNERLNFENIVKLLENDRFAIEEFGMKTDINELHEYQKRIGKEDEKTIIKKIPKIIGRKNEFIWTRH